VESHLTSTTCCYVSAARNYATSPFATGDEDFGSLPNYVAECAKLSSSPRSTHARFPNKQPLTRRTYSAGSPKRSLYFLSSDDHRAGDAGRTNEALQDDLTYNCDVGHMHKNKQTEPDPLAFEVTNSPTETARFQRLVKRYTLTGSGEKDCRTSSRRTRPISPSCGSARR
jgi:hypothetical protein